MHLEPVIGLEIHIQLKTKSKMFSACPAHDTAKSPNSHIDPVIMGHPGTLPVVNEEAIRFGILMGLALNCEIAPYSKFDRKHYFYPDLPKGYQISQFDLPIAEKGYLEFEVPKSDKNPVRIGITRAHLEEDAAKSFHGEGEKTYVDYNRAGTPLIEIVTEPDFKSPEEAKVFLQELRLIARYLGISDADMEKGHLRCDANISLRQYNEAGRLVGPEFNPKTEIKNINSFKAVERALEYEIMRQKKLWNEAKPPDKETTRGWNDAKQMTEEQRSKETSGDYRYFPEPDIPPLELTALAEQMRTKLPELPIKRRARFEEEYLLSPSNAKQICDDPLLANYTEYVFSELEAWLNSLPDVDNEEILEKNKKKMAKVVSSWLITKLGGLMNNRGVGMKTLKISPENFAEFVTLILTSQLTNKNALIVLGEMLESGIDPSHVMEEKRLGLVQDEDFVAEIVDRVIAANPSEHERYKAGELKLLKFFIGQVMKESEGKADPGMIGNVLKVKLEE